jgi:Zn-dependent protease with chaperone function
VIVSVYCPLVLPLLAVPAVGWVGGRLHPAWASWLVLVWALVLATCATLALGLLMFAALSLVGPFDRLGHWSRAVLQQQDAIHPVVDIAAALLLVALTGNALVVGIRRIKALSTAYRAAGQGDDELVVVDDERPLAHALPGRPGRIVVSTSMLSTLEPAERRALLAHERAHLAHSHHLFVAVVDVLAALVPLLRPLASVIRFTTERWADETAATHVGDRSVVARALAKAALASKGRQTGGSAAMAVSGGPVPRRVAALLAGPPSGRLRTTVVSLSSASAVVVCCLVFGSVFFSCDAVTDLHRVVELAQVTHHGGMRWR